MGGQLLLQELSFYFIRQMYHKISAWNHLWRISSSQLPRDAFLLYVQHKQMLMTTLPYFVWFLTFVTSAVFYFLWYSVSSFQIVFSWPPFPSFSPWVFKWLSHKLTSIFSVTCAKEVWLSFPYNFIYCSSLCSGTSVRASSFVRY